MHTIRKATPEDLSEMLAIYAKSVRTSSASFECEPPTADEFAERYRRITERFPWLVCELEGQVAGYIYASAPFQRTAYQWNAELSVYVGEAFQRRHVAQALTKAMHELLFRQGFCKVMAVIVASNEPSLRLVAELGFVEEARFVGVGYKLGQWHDVVWLSTFLRPLPQAPEPPVSWMALPSNDVDDILRNATPHLH